MLQEIATANLKILLVLSPVGAAVARSLDMGKVTGSNPVLGIFYWQFLPIKYALVGTTTACCSVRI